MGPLLDRVEDWAEFLDAGLSAAEHRAIASAERTGRPLGSAEFVVDLERRLGRVLTRRKPGPKPKGSESESYV